MMLKANASMCGTVADLALSLWPDHEKAEFMQEFSELAGREDAVVFLEMLDGQAVGFAQCQLRYDYVEGTSSSPVGYLEGIYVKPAFRGRGVAKAMLAACETWAREKGCREFASDCELSNQDSLYFHLHSGFSEAGRIICFTKPL